jgi:putative oxidoreductase
MTLPVTRDKLIDVSLLVLRLGFGLSLAWLHGRGKLQSAAAYFLSGREWAFIPMVASLGFPFAPLFATAAALAESIGGVLLAAGVATRLAGGAVAFTMVIAVVSHLRAGQAPELATLYLIPAVALAIAGPGRYSLEHLAVHRRRQNVAAATLQ